MICFSTCEGPGGLHTPGTDSTDGEICSSRWLSWVAVWPGSSPRSPRGEENAPSFFISLSSLSVHLSSSPLSSFSSSSSSSSPPHTRQRIHSLTHSPDQLSRSTLTLLLSLSHPHPHILHTLSLSHTLTMNSVKGSMKMNSPLPKDLAGESFFLASLPRLLASSPCLVSPREHSLLNQQPPLLLPLR